MEDRPTVYRVSEAEAWRAMLAGDVDTSAVSIGEVPFAEWQRARLNPDCKAEKHQSCSADSWDPDADQPRSCTCPCHYR